MSLHSISKVLAVLLIQPWVRVFKHVCTSSMKLSSLAVDLIATSISNSNYGIDNGSAGGRRGLPDTTVNIISLLFVIL